MRTVLLLLAMIGAPLAGVRTSHAADTADLVLRHGVFYPVQPATRLEGALAVRDGRIAYLGDDAGVVPWIGGDTQVIDLGGRTVTPGLIDAHSHLEGLGAALESVDLRGAASFDEVIRRTAEAATKLPVGAWVDGRGWDQNLWPDKQFPNHAALSAAIPDHPVWLTRVDGHAVLLNAAAMRALGVTGSDPDPSGGRILRDAAGAPTGVLVDNAVDHFGSRRSAPAAEDHRRRIARGAAAAAAVGLTGASDMGCGPETVDAYRALQAAGELPIRVGVFLDGKDPLLAQRLERGPWTSDDAQLVIRGVKLYADGALGSRGAALLESYADDPGNMGLVTTPEAEMERVSRLALAAGFQVAIHAIGDRGNLLALDAMDAAFGGLPHPQARFRIEHVQIVRHQDLERMARLGIIASMQPTHATSDMPWAEDRLGAYRLDRAYAWRTALDAGARLALGSDFPVEKPDPLLGIYAAVTRQDLDGNPPGGWLPGQRLTRAEALRGFTLDAAYALFLDDQVGSLEVGKRADLVVLDRDIMTVPEHEISGTRVDYTIVGGRVVHRREGAP